MKRRPKYEKEISKYDLMPYDGNGDGSWMR